MAYTVFFLVHRRAPRPTLFPYTTLFRSRSELTLPKTTAGKAALSLLLIPAPVLRAGIKSRSEEHTSELQSPDQLVCRLLLEKKKNKEEERGQQDDLERGGTGHSRTALSR